MVKHKRNPSINQVELQQVSQSLAPGSYGSCRGHLLRETDVHAEDSIAVMNNVPTRDHRAGHFDHSVHAADAAPKRGQASPSTVRSVQVASALPVPDDSRRMQRMVVCATWSTLVALVVTFWTFAIIGVVHTVGLSAY